ncbi:hypothetical protein BDZ89DRAFT_1144689 [Hymenopellis radicata]|nr:hypothetical protein BDZ89DRAFT_1144689 [Hymenopellis radicata]
MATTDSGLEMRGFYPRRCLRDASWPHLASRRWERLHRPIGDGVLSGRVVDEPALVFSASTLTVFAERDVGISRSSPGRHTSVLGQTPLWTVISREDVVVGTVVLRCDYEVVVRPTLQEQDRSMESTPSLWYYDVRRARQMWREWWAGDQDNRRLQAGGWGIGKEDIVVNPLAPRGDLTRSPHAMTYILASVDVGLDVFSRYFIYTEFEPRSPKSDFEGIDGLHHTRTSITPPVSTLKFNTTPDGPHLKPSLGGFYYERWGDAPVHSRP